MVYCSSKCFICLMLMGRDTLVSSLAVDSTQPTLLNAFPNRNTWGKDPTSSSSASLLYHLFDHEMRHNFMKNLSVCIKKDPASFNEFSQLLSSEEWKGKIVEAGENPTSKVAKEVLSTVIPVLNFGNGEKNIMGSLGDSSALTRAIAMMHRYGSELPIVDGCVWIVKSDSHFFLLSNCCRCIMLLDHHSK